MFRVLNQFVRNRTRRRRSRTIMRIEPGSTLNLVSLNLDLPAIVFGRKAKHELRGERPALTAEVADVANAEVRLFIDLTCHGIFDRLTRLDEASDTGVDVGVALHMTRKQDLIITMNEHDDAGFDARELQHAAFRTSHGRKRVMRQHRSATMTAIMRIANPADKRLGTRGTDDLIIVTFVEMSAYSNKLIGRRQKFLMNDREGTDATLLLLNELFALTDFPDQEQIVEREQ